MYAGECVSVTLLGAHLRHEAPPDVEDPSVTHAVSRRAHQRALPRWRTLPYLPAFAMLFPALTPLCPAQVQQPGSQQLQVPQVISVPVPSMQTPASQSGSVTDWSQAAQNSARANSVVPAFPAAPALPNDATVAPTEFQELVRRTTGETLPIFGSNLFRNSPSTFAPVIGAQVTSDYVIGPGDEIRLSTTGQLNQQGAFVVDRAGTITIPQVGTVTVSGLRFEELKPFLLRELGRVYRNFQLNVTLGQTRAIQVYVTGEARRPGSYTISALSTLLNAVFASGGVLPQGSMRSIELRRGSTLVTTFDLYDLLLRGDKTHDVTLQPGDVIFIPKVGPQVAAVGSVTNPAVYELRGETSVAQLLSLANGPTSTAQETNARVESIFNHAQRTVTELDLRTDGNRALQDGDILTVSAISGQFRQAVTLRGNVTYPGRYTWRPGLRLSDVIPNREALLTRGFFRAQNDLARPETVQGNALPGEGQVALGNPLYGQTAAGQTVAGQTVAGQTVAGQTAPGQYQDLSAQAPGTNGQYGAAATQAGAQTSLIPDLTQNTSGTQRSISPSANAPSTMANMNGSGTSVGDALTQNNGNFPASNSVVLGAPDVDLSYAVIERLDETTLTTNLVPFNLGKMLAGDTTQNLELKPGDVVTVFSQADIRVAQAQRTRFVRLEGEFVSSGIYSVLPGETLRQLVARAGGLSPDAYLYASEFTRESTRRVEQQRLREFADTLESEIAIGISDQLSGNATVVGNSEAVQAAANASAEVGRSLVNRLRTTQPTGRVVLKVSPDSSGLAAIPDIPLEDGDRFIVPRQPSTIAVSGQVYNASAFLFQPGAEVREYLRSAGGPQRNADDKRIFLVRADGSVVSQQYSNVARARIFPGDTIIVPPRLTHSSTLRDIVLVGSLIGNLATPFSLLAVLLK